MQDTAVSIMSLFAAAIRFSDISALAQPLVGPSLVTGWTVTGCAATGCADCDNRHTVGAACWGPAAKSGRFTGMRTSTVVPTPT